MNSSAHHLKVVSGPRAKVLLTRVGVSAAYLPQEAPPAIQEFVGLWDTGATQSVITRKIVDALSLVTVGPTPVHHVQGLSYSNAYLISLAFLQSKVRFNELRVTEGLLPADVDLLIGMDVVSSGDLLITNFRGHTELHFQCPANGVDHLARAIKTFPKNAKPMPVVQPGPTKPAP